MTVVVTLMLSAIHLEGVSPLERTGVISSVRTAAADLKVLGATSAVPGRRLVGPRDFARPARAAPLRRIRGLDRHRVLRRGRSIHPRQRSDETSRVRAVRLRTVLGAASSRARHGAADAE